MVAMRTALFCAFVAAGCATTNGEQPPERTPTHIEIFYATDRAYDATEDPGDRFSGDRSKGGTMRFGAWPITVPRDHELGEIESEGAWLSAPPQELDPDAFLKRLDGKPVLIFVHGYNETFRQSILLTAQIAYDLGFDGSVIAYSWPSDGNPLVYATDQADAGWSVAQFRCLVRDLEVKSGATKIHVIAHSMGATVVAPALARPLCGRAKSKLGQLVFAAPDIDADVLRDLIPDFAGLVDRITIYTSTEDRSLQLSALGHGGHDRAGELTETGIIHGVDVIDASIVESGFWNHKYYAQHRVVLDIHYLLRLGLPPDSRYGLQRAGLNGSTYWRISR